MSLEQQIDKINAALTAGITETTVKAVGLVKPIVAKGQKHNHDPKTGLDGGLDDSVNSSWFHVVMNADYDVKKEYGHGKLYDKPVTVALVVYTDQAELQPYIETKLAGMLDVTLLRLELDHETVNSRYLQHKRVINYERQLFAIEYEILDTLSPNACRTYNL